MSPLEPVAGTISKLVALLGSDQPGEVLSTVKVLIRTLKAEGLDLHDLAAAVMAAPIVAPEPTVPEMFDVIWSSGPSSDLPVRLLSLQGQWRLRKRFSSKESAEVGRLYGLASASFLRALRRARRLHRALLG
jgi:hypothetical protein